MQPQGDFPFLNSGPILYRAIEGPLLYYLDKKYRREDTAVFFRQTGNSEKSCYVYCRLSINFLGVPLFWRRNRGVYPFLAKPLYLNRHTPSGQSRVYRVTQLRTDGVHCRESAGTGPVNFMVVPNECCLGKSPGTN